LTKKRESPLEPALTFPVFSSWRLKRKEEEERSGKRARKEGMKQEDGRQRRTKTKSVCAMLCCVFFYRARVRVMSESVAEVNHLTETDSKRQVKEEGGEEERRE
jgi:hypothetical protein